MKDDRIYTTLERIFETFPFPADFEASSRLGEVGSTYNERRSAIMMARDDGLTKTYNRFHRNDDRSDDIEDLRQLHAAMDRAVLRAYGWDDLADRADPIFLDEANEDDHTYQGRYFWPSSFHEEVLARLLALNAERAAAERESGLVAKADEDDDEIDDEGEAA